MTVVFCWFSNFESTPSSYLYSKFLESFTTFTVNLRSQSVHFKTGRLCQLFCIWVFHIGKKYTVLLEPLTSWEIKIATSAKICSNTLAYICRASVKAKKNYNLFSPIHSISGWEIDIHIRGCGEGYECRIYTLF